MSILSNAERRATALPMGPLYAALSAAQGEFPDIPKTKTGHGYKYADIADILKAVRPVLSKHGLAAFQTIEGDSLKTTLAHASGVTLTSSYPLVQDGTGRMNNIQRYGAALTYARRYSLTALLGVAADEDVDASEVEISGRDEGRQVAHALRDAWVDAVLDALPENAGDREKAEAFAAAVAEEMRSKKSKRGVEAAWQKREKILTALDKKHNDLFQDLTDIFSSCLSAFEEEAA